MKFTEGLKKARGQIVFLVGLIAGLVIIMKLEKLNSENSPQQSFQVEKTMNIPAPTPARLSGEEMEWAKTAWQYFVNNTDPKTGLVNSVDNYPSTTMWDAGSYLLAVISSYRLGIIDSADFNARISRSLESLASLPLFDNLLPNKVYNVKTLEMVNYQNKKSDRGIGWSAIDIGRLMVPFNILVWNYPSYTVAASKVLARWKFSSLLNDGYLQGAAVDKNGKTVMLQEGRIGYEEYAAKSFTLIGKDVAKALKYQDHLKYIDVYGLKIPTDRRDPKELDAHNYVVSENYILDGIEFGWDAVSAEFAYRVYRAQEERYNKTGTLTAVSEDHLDRDPYFVYNTVFTDGKTWNCITEDGKDAGKYKTISIKSVFGWHCLYSTSYTGKLIDSIKEQKDSSKGWYAGIYEQDGKPNKAISCNTNAIILESLCYKQFGKLINF